MSIDNKVISYPQETFHDALVRFFDLSKKPTNEELLKAFNSGETVEDGLEEVFRLGQKHFLAK